MLARSSTVSGFIKSMAGVVSVGIVIALLWRIFHKIGELKKNRRNFWTTTKIIVNFFAWSVYLFCQFLTILAYHRFSYSLLFNIYITPGFRNQRKTYIMNIYYYTLTNQCFPLLPSSLSHISTLFLANFVNSS